MIRRRHRKIGVWVVAIWGILGATGWGFSAHRRIQEAAIHALPPALHGFYKSHQAWLVAHAVDADLRKHTVEGEDVKHYIDLDRYHNNLDSLQDLFPMSWRASLEKWGEEEVRENGIGPWNAVWTYRKLVDAFAALDSAGILRHSADLGHYVGDLNVPLHTTENYNGQLTRQDGIHGLWETQVPEMEMDRYSLQVEKPVIERNVEAAIWQMVFRSHAAVDSVLEAERMLTEAWGERASHAYVERGRTLQKLRSPEFAQAFSERLDGQVERQMQHSVHAIATLWWSAWVEAGEPDLAPIEARTERDTMNFWQKLKAWAIG